MKEIDDYYIVVDNGQIIYTNQAFKIKTDENILEQKLFLLGK